MLLFIHSWRVRDLRSASKTLIPNLQFRHPFELAAVSSLAANYPAAELRYLRERLSLTVSQQRARLTFMLGSSALIPITLAAYIGARDLLDQSPSDKGWLMLVFVAVLLLYWRGVDFMAEADRIQRLALIAQEAAELKRQKTASEL